MSWGNSPGREGLIHPSSNAQSLKLTSAENRLSTRLARICSQRQRKLFRPCSVINSLMSDRLSPVPPRLSAKLQKQVGQHDKGCQGRNTMSSSPSNDLREQHLRGGKATGGETVTKRNGSGVWKSRSLQVSTNSGSSSRVLEVTSHYGDPKHTRVVTATKAASSNFPLEDTKEIYLPSLHRRLLSDPPSPGLEIKLSAYT